MTRIPFVNGNIPNNMAYMIYVSLLVITILHIALGVHNAPVDSVAPLQNPEYTDVEFSFFIPKYRTDPVNLIYEFQFSDHDLFYRMSAAFDIFPVDSCDSNLTVSYEYTTLLDEEIITSTQSRYTLTISWLDILASKTECGIKYFILKVFPESGPIGVMKQGRYEPTDISTLYAIPPLPYIDSLYWSYSANFFNFLPHNQDKIPSIQSYITRYPKEDQDIVPRIVFYSTGRIDGDVMTVIATVSLLVENTPVRCTSEISDVHKSSSDMFYVDVSLQNLCNDQSSPLSSLLSWTSSTNIKGLEISLYWKGYPDNNPSLTSLNTASIIYTTSSNLPSIIFDTSNTWYSRLYNNLLETDTAYIPPIINNIYTLHFSIPATDPKDGISISNTYQISHVKCDVTHLVVHPSSVKSHRLKTVNISYINDNSNINDPIGPFTTTFELEKSEVASIETNSALGHSFATSTGLYFNPTTCYGYGRYIANNQISSYISFVYIKQLGTVVPKFRFSSSDVLVWVTLSQGIDNTTGLLKEYNMNVYNTNYQYSPAFTYHAITFVEVSYSVRGLDTLQTTYVPLKKNGIEQLFTLPTRSLEYTDFIPLSFTIELDTIMNSIVDQTVYPRSSIESFSRLGVSLTVQKNEQNPIYNGESRSSNKINQRMCLPPFKADCSDYLNTAPPCISNNTLYADNDTCVCKKDFIGPICEQLIQCQDEYIQLNECNHHGIVGYNPDIQQCNKICTCTSEYNTNETCEHHVECYDNIIMNDMCNNHGTINPIYDNNNNIRECSTECTCYDTGLWDGATCHQSVPCRKARDSLKCGSYGIVTVIEDDDNTTNIPTCDAKCTCLHGYIGPLCAICPIQCYQGTTKATCRDDIKTQSPCSCQNNALGRYCQYLSVHTDLTVNNRVSPQWLLDSIMSKSFENNETSSFINDLQNLFNNLLNIDSSNILTNTSDTDKPLIYRNDPITQTIVPVLSLSVGTMKCKSNNKDDDDNNNMIDVSHKLSFRVSVRVGSKISLLNKESNDIYSRWNVLKSNNNIVTQLGIILDKHGIIRLGSNDDTKNCIYNDNDDDIIINPIDPESTEEEEQEETSNDTYNYMYNIYIIALSSIFIVFLF